MTWDPQQVADSLTEALVARGFQPSGELAGLIVPLVARARAEAFAEAANRLTLDSPQACLNWCADQARTARGEQPFHDWSQHRTQVERNLALRTIPGAAMGRPI